MHKLGECSCRTRPWLLLRELCSVVMCLVAFQSGRRSQSRVENRYCCLQEAIRVSIVETQPPKSRQAPQEATITNIQQHVAINDSKTLTFQGLEIVNVLSKHCSSDGRRLSIKHPLQRFLPPLHCNENLTPTQSFKVVSKKSSIP